MNWETYRKDPCRASSMPFWKTETLALPDTVRVIREDAWDGCVPEDWTDEPYFKLMHCLQDLTEPALPEGFCLTEADDAELSAQIRACYGGSYPGSEDLAAFRERTVYAPELWLALREQTSGRLAASAIAEWDKKTDEAALEWVQVSAAFRRRGLGGYMVRELLFRLRGKAEIVTVSGKWGDASRLERLYQSCGFENIVIWHVLRRTAHT